MSTAPPSRVRILACATALAASLALPAAAGADHGASYRGSYANSMLAGETKDGRSVAVMAGVHDDFPYHDPGSDYDQVAVWVEGERPLVVTGRPSLADLRLSLDEPAGVIAYAGPRLSLSLRLRTHRHVPRYYGDPAQLGDSAIAAGYEPSESSPGLVYTPFELRDLVRGTLRVRGARLRLRSLHGQAEAGTIEAPSDPRFRSAYDYVAAPAVPPAPPFTFVAFSTRALHSGADGVLGDYFRATGSDGFTLEDGTLTPGNPHAAPQPFDNTAGLPAGARAIGAWTVDLGPGTLHRAFVRMRSASGERLVALSESITEDAAG